MLPLIDTAIGFVAIMLTLSMLVKSVTSLIKNYVDYYTENLRTEVDSFLQGATNKGLKDLVEDQLLRKGMNWKVIGEEFLTAKNMKNVLTRIGVKLDEEEIEQRVQLHLANLRYAFEQRMKNLALAVGLGLCLLLDVNAFTIWKTLYADQQVRDTFASEYSQKAMKLAGEPTAAKPAADKKELEDRAKKLREEVGTFMADVSFGVGRIWREPAEEMTSPAVLYEFLGALLTGLFVSIGAPYWHDLLRALANLRKRPAAPG